MDEIFYVPPEFNLKAARNKLSRGLFKKIRPDNTELIWLPGYLFNVNVLPSNGKSLSELIMVDGIKGELNYLGNVKPMKTSEKMSKVVFRIKADDAKKIASKEYQRLLFWKILKTKVTAKINELTFIGNIFYPFWFGFFEKSHSYDFTVIDGVNGGKQGVKMKSLFSDLIIHSHE